MSPYKFNSTTQNNNNNGSTGGDGAAAAGDFSGDGPTTTKTIVKSSSASTLINNNNNNSNTASLNHNNRNYSNNNISDGNIVARKLLLQNNDNNSNHSHKNYYLSSRNTASSSGLIEMGTTSSKPTTILHDNANTAAAAAGPSTGASVSTSGLNSYSSRKSQASPSSSNQNHHHHNSNSSPNHQQSSSSINTSRHQQQQQQHNNGPLATIPAAPVPEVREYLFKLLVIGELGTGKTSFIKRYVHQYFSQHYRATIGVDFALKVLNWDENSLIRLQLWDIAGQERFGNMTRVYYKEAVGAFLAFDVNVPQTFNAVLKWKHDLDTKVCLADGNPIPCLLLANKCDSQKEQLDAQMLDKYVLENGFCGWFYTSAKDNINIEQAAKFLVGKILQRQKHFVMEETDDNRDIISLNYSSHSNNKSAKKCSC